MGTTSIELTSQALSLIRANVISSFTDDSDEAQIADLYYTSFIQDALSRYPWSFATKKKKLNQDSAAPLNEYTYSHIIPAEALVIKQVFDSGQVGAKAVKDYDMQQKRIYSDYNEIWVEYTAYVDESNFPAYFTNYAMYALAAHLAIPVTDDETLHDRFHTIAYGTPAEGERGGKFKVAAGIDARQRPPEEIHDNVLIAARFS